MEEKKGIEDQSMFEGRGPPALLSLKEPAIRKLNERYSNSFAIAPGKINSQVHLFLVKVGMWALVYTFTPRDTNESLSEERLRIDSVLRLIEDAMDGRDKNLLERLDKSVSRALSRISVKQSDSNL